MSLLAKRRDTAPGKLTTAVRKTEEGKLDTRDSWRCPASEPSYRFSRAARVRRIESVGENIPVQQVGSRSLLSIEYISIATPICLRLLVQI